MLNKNNKLNDESLSEVNAGVMGHGGSMPSADQVAEQILSLFNEIGDGRPTDEQGIMLRRLNALLTQVLRMSGNGASSDNVRRAMQKLNVMGF